MDETDKIMDEAGEQLVLNCYNASNLLAKLIYKYQRENPWPHVEPLNDVVMCFMTELWDWNFSQSEIREAFLEALAGMDRYAAGQERRS